MSSVFFHSHGVMPGAARKEELILTAGEKGIRVASLSYPTQRDCNKYLRWINHIHERGLLIRLALLDLR